MSDFHPQEDHLAQTQPHLYLDPVRRAVPPFLLEESRRKFPWSACIFILLTGLGFLMFVGFYFLAPMRTNVLLLGIDSRLPESVVGRSDTMILATVSPLKPYVGLLSIPRDLWVEVPGHGENRINTAHFFGEAQQPGSGPAAAMQVVAWNFGLDVHYYARIRFEGLKAVVDAMGGIEVSLPEPMSGYPAGRHHLNGDQALALVRDRQGSDDFFRMQRGQIFLKAMLQQAIHPKSWGDLPNVLPGLPGLIDTDLPFWLWPRLGLALLRAGPEGIDTRTIDREMVRPFTTSGGAAVLEPDWIAIQPVLVEMFGKK